MPALKGFKRLAEHEPLDARGIQFIHELLARPRPFNDEAGIPALPVELLEALYNLGQLCPPFTIDRAQKRNKAIALPSSPWNSNLSP